MARDLMPGQKVKPLAPDLARPDARADAEEAARGQDPAFLGRDLPDTKHCLVCHGRLGLGERKVHVGACRREWRAGLQRKRRRLQR